MKAWKVELDEYQRANLLWLIELCGYPCASDGSPSGVEPFTYANTGDWIGELYWKLEGDRDRERAPNETSEHMRERVARFLTANLTIGLIASKTE